MSRDPRHLAWTVIICAALILAIDTAASLHHNSWPITRIIIMTAAALSGLSAALSIRHMRHRASPDRFRPL